LCLARLKVRSRKARVGDRLQKMATRCMGRVASRLVSNISSAAASRRGLADAAPALASDKLHFNFFLPHKAVMKAAEVVSSRIQSCWAR
jgi:hypothetical protein